MERERMHPQRHTRHTGGSPGASGHSHDVERLRAETAGLLEAAEQAVGRHLSQNSDEFLRAAPQEGGQ